MIFVMIQISLASKLHVVTLESDAPFSLDLFSNLNSRSRAWTVHCLGSFSDSRHNIEKKVARDPFLQISFPIWVFSFPLYLYLPFSIFLAPSVPKRALNALFLTLFLGFWFVLFFFYGIFSGCIWNMWGFILCFLNKNMSQFFFLFKIFGNEMGL